MQKWDFLRQCEAIAHRTSVGVIDDPSHQVRLHEYERRLMEWRNEGQHVHEYIREFDLNDKGDKTDMWKAWEWHAEQFYGIMAEYADVLSQPRANGTSERLIDYEWCMSVWESREFVYERDSRSLPDCERGIYSVFMHTFLEYKRIIAEFADVHDIWFKLQRERETARRSRMVTKRRRRYNQKQS